MPYRRFDWHQHIMDVWGEYRSTRVAVDRLKAAVAESDEDPGPMTIDRARAQLQAYLHELPDEWG